MNKGIKILGEPCLICGSTSNIEMHHVKSLKDMKPLKNAFLDKQRAALRKQIPLCRDHHLQIHNYNWRNSAMSVKQLKSQMNIIKPDDIGVVNSVEVGEPSDG
jgi:hypothetical protein